MCDKHVDCCRMFHKQLLKGETLDVPYQKIVLGEQLNHTNYKMAHARQTVC